MAWLQVAMRTPGIVHNNVLEAPLHGGAVHEIHVETVDIRLAIPCKPKDGWEHTWQATPCQLASHAHTPGRTQLPWPLQFKGHRGPPPAGCTSIIRVNCAVSCMPTSTLCLWMLGCSPMPQF